MNSFKVIGLFVFFVVLSDSSFSMTLCQDPVVAGGYINSPTCVAATDASDEEALQGKGLPYRELSPYIATLEPVLDQNQKRYIFNAYYRYIDLAVDESFKWYLDDGDPDQQAYVEITPSLINGQPQIKFDIKNLAQIRMLPGALVVSDSVCTGSIVSGYECPSFNDFLSKMVLFAKVLGVEQTLNYLSELSPDEALEVKEKTMEDGSKKAYLSIRYVQTCSGSLLAGGKIMSAGHCYYNVSNDEWDSANIHKVYIAGNDWQSSPYVAMAHDLSPHSHSIAPNYKGGSPTDYAIVNTETIEGYESFDSIEAFEISSQKVFKKQKVDFSIKSSEKEATQEQQLLTVLWWITKEVIYKAIFLTQVMTMMKK